MGPPGPPCETLGDSLPFLHRRRTGSIGIERSRESLLVLVGRHQLDNERYQDV